MTASRDPILRLARGSRLAAPQVALMSDLAKRRALLAMADALERNTERVLKANDRDLEAARRAHMAPAMLARLTLDHSKIVKIAGSIRQIAKLPDPVGRVLSKTGRPNGLFIKKVSVPLGVILIIYESRPNVTADCMALCLRSGNSVLLKGGSEAIHSNRALYEVLSSAARKAGVPDGALGFVDTRSRPAVRRLLQMDTLIDLVIPRGGEGLIREVARISRIPVIKHYKGVCHVYIDKRADEKKALAIVLNAKTQNPSVCNAAEALLVHRDLARTLLPKLESALKAKNVKLLRARSAWGREFLDLTMAVRVVKDVREAVRHIETYGSRHSDAIVTEDREAARYFTEHVDSSAVFVNASTRFNDGGEFGLGAEMGISTDKLHARGPMGLAELTSYKYVVLGDGQVRG